MMLRMEGRSEVENIMKSCERGWLMCVVCRMERTGFYNVEDGGKE